MYNDYYLQEISSKLTTTNDLLEDVLTRQALLVSGDNIINDSINNNTSYLIGGVVYLLIVIFVLLFYNFYRGCFKGR